MRVNCLSCGHMVDLDETYEDFEGPIRCLCGAILTIRMEDGRLKEISLSGAHRSGARAAEACKTVAGEARE